jgi:hypothetical protein
MNELYVKMLQDLKDNRWSVLKIEKHLGFANGILGKVAAGKANLSAEKDKQFHEFYSQYGANKVLFEDATGPNKPQDEKYQEELKATIERLSKENAELRKLTNNDLFTFGTAITKEEKGAKTKSISPISEEGSKVLAIADGIDKQEAALKAQIASIRAEKLPDHRNTSMGKRSWEIEQKNRVNELLKQIEELNGHSKPEKK